MITVAGVATAARVITQQCVLQLYHTEDDCLRPVALAHVHVHRVVGAVHQLDDSLLPVDDRDDDANDIDQRVRLCTSQRFDGEQ